METRVLTLFDDEDFFPQEETPKKTSKKTTAAKEEPADTDEIVAEQPLFAEEVITEAPLEVTTPIAQEITNIPAATTAPEAVIEPEEAVLTTAQEDTNIPIADAEPETVTEPEEEALPIVQEDIQTPEVEPEQETIAATVVEAAVSEPEILVSPQQAVPIPAAEDELSKQLLHELIQQDYTAFIHRDYPFDVQQASVVKKDKDIKPIQPIVEDTAVATEDEVFEDVVPLPEWKLDKKYYTIGEVAQLFAVNTSHIRFWTNEFKLKPRTTRKGDRLYSPKDIAELRLIHHLVKEKKHTIKGAREKLKVEKVGVNQKLDLKESLTGLKDMLLQIKEQL